MIIRNSAITKNLCKILFPSEFIRPMQITRCLIRATLYSVNAKFCIECTAQTDYFPPITASLLMRRSKITKQKKMEMKKFSQAVQLYAYYQQQTSTILPSCLQTLIFLNNYQDYTATCIIHCKLHCTTVLQYCRSV